MTYFSQLFQNLPTTYLQIRLYGQMVTLCLSFQYQNTVKNGKQSHTDLSETDDTTKE